MREIKVLHLSPDFNISCGVSKYLKILFGGFSENNSFKLHFITNGGDDTGSLTNYKLKHEIVPFAKGFKNVFYYKSFYNQLKKYALKNDINIIHSHHRFPEYAAWKLSLEVNIKTISTVHSLTKGLRNISYKSDRIIAVSKSVKQNLVAEYKVSEEKIYQIYNPILPLTESVSKTEARKNLNISNDGFVILFVGTICKRKGFDFLLSVFNQLQTKHSNLLLVVVGEWKGFNKEEVSKNERIITFDSMIDIYPFYTAADVVVLPSRKDPFPYTMLESGVYEKPFIGSNVDGIKEFIEDGKDGLLFESGNTDALCDKIIELINDHSLRATLAENLYNKVIPLTDTKQYVEQLQIIYNQMMQ